MFVIFLFEIVDNIHNVFGYALREKVKHAGEYAEEPYCAYNV